MLAPQAETLEGATEPPGRLDDIVSDSAAASGPEDDQGDNPWRRPIALGISGLFLLFGIQLAYSGPRPQWSTARANESEIPAAATVEQATSQQVVSLASTSTGWDEEPVVEEKVEPAPAPAPAPKAPAGLPRAPRVAMKFPAALPGSSASAADARTVDGLLADYGKAYENARSSPRLRHAGGPAEPAVRVVASHSGWWRHRHPARPRGRDQLHPCVPGAGGLDRADVPGFVHRDVARTSAGRRRWRSGGTLATVGKESSELASLTDRLLAEDRQRARGAEPIEAGAYQLVNGNIQFEDPAAARKYGDLRRNINAAMDAARIAGGEESEGPMGYLLRRSGLRGSRWRSDRPDIAVQGRARDLIRGPGQHPFGELTLAPGGQGLERFQRRDAGAAHAVVVGGDEIDQSVLHHRPRQPPRRRDWSGRSGR